MIVHTNWTLSRVFGSVLGGLGLDTLRPLLLYGPQGVGKRTYLEEFIRSSACKVHKPFLDPEKLAYRGECDCPSCARLKGHHSPDVLYLDGSEGVDDFKELVSTFVYRQPLELDYRFIVAEHVHRYSGATANTFLKVLEEHPKWLRIFTTTPRRDLVVPTIVSRCHCFKFPPLSRTQLEHILALDSNLTKYKAALEKVPFDSVDSLVVWHKHLFEEHYEQFFGKLAEVTTLEEHLSRFLARLREDGSYRAEYSLQQFLRYARWRSLTESSASAEQKYELLNRYLEEIWRHFETTLVHFLDRGNYSYYINVEQQLYLLCSSVLCTRRELKV